MAYDGFDLDDLEAVMDAWAADWPEPYDDELSYVEPDTLPPLAAAVLRNDLERIRTLVEGGEDINKRDKHANTPLHIAVLKKIKEVFDYLLTREDIQLDAQNCKNETPLVIATTICDPTNHYALRLINRGANVDLADKSLQTPLHYAAGFSKRITQTLIDFGADVNAYAPDYGTPILKAVTRDQIEIGCMLICNGAHPHMHTITGNSALIESFKLNVPRHFQEMLVDCTFEEHTKQPVDLGIYTKLLCSSINDDILDKLYEVTSEIIFNEDDLLLFESQVMHVIPVLSFNKFKKFFETFPDFFREYFAASHNFVLRYVWYLVGHPQCSNHLMDVMFLIFNSPIIGDIVESSQHVSSTISKLVRVFQLNSNLPSDKLPVLIFGLLSYGFELGINDLCTVFNVHGAKSCLYQTLLLFPMNLHCRGNCWHSLQAVLPAMMVNIKLEFWMVSQYVEYMNPESIEHCLGFFVDRNLREMGLIFLDAEKVINLKTVPSLLELARTETRRYIIKTFKIKKSWMFYDFLKRLPINQVYKDIIGYQRKIYRI